MEFIYGIKYEYNIYPTVVFLFGTVKNNTIIESAQEVTPLSATNPMLKNHCKR